MERYQQILLPCPATSKSSWNKCVASGTSLVYLWNSLQRNLNHDQLWVIRDTKLNKDISQDEFNNIVCKLKGWMK